MHLNVAVDLRVCRHSRVIATSAQFNHAAAEMNISRKVVLVTRAISVT